uniref:Ribosomal protein L15 n=1 Tax=Mustela putorius furo TaxID=9669 RepID=M3Y4Z9_MUSPF
GRLKYIQELWRKKQSGVMHFLLRVHCWQYPQLCRAPPHAANSPPKPADKAHGLGPKAKQGYVIYQIHHSGPKRLRPRASPSHHGANQLRFPRSLQWAAEEPTGCHCGSLRVLNSYWVGKDSRYKFFEVILIDPFHKAMRRNPDTKSAHKHRMTQGLTSAGHQSRKGHGFQHPMNGSCLKAWGRHNTLCAVRYN